MQSFTKLTDLSKINVEPKRIRIKTVNQAGTLNSVLQGYGINSSGRKREHAILNGMELTDQLGSGMLLKIIE